MNAQQLREHILNHKSLRSEVVPCPEWGTSVCIREMSGRERDEWEQTLLGPDKKADIRNVRARLVVYTAVDAEGNRVFSAADADALGELSASALSRCAAVAQRLNGLSEKDLEQAKGNSEGVPTASSSSTLQGTSGA